MIQAAVAGDPAGFVSTAIKILNTESVEKGKGISFTGIGELVPQAAAADGLAHFVRMVGNRQIQIPRAVIWHPAPYETYNLFAELSAAGYKGKQVLLSSGFGPAYPKFRTYADDSFNPLMDGYVGRLIDRI